MSEKAMRFSDLSGRMAENPEDLVGMVVHHHPDLDEPVRLEGFPAELSQVGKLAMAGVLIEIEQHDEDGPVKYVLSVNNFNKLADGQPMNEVLAAAEPLTVRKPGLRRSHNITTAGGPLVNYNDPENAGMPHKGKIGEEEAGFVRENLSAVNERRAAAGHPPIDPGKPEFIRRYGFEAAPETPATEPAAD